MVESDRSGGEERPARVRLEGHVTGRLTSSDPNLQGIPCCVSERDRATVHKVVEAVLGAEHPARMKVRVFASNGDLKWQDWMPNGKYVEHFPSHTGGRIEISAD